MKNVTPAGESDRVETLGTNGIMRQLIQFRSSNRGQIYRCRHHQHHRTRQVMNQLWGSIDRQGRVARYKFPSEGGQPNNDKE